MASVIGVPTLLSNPEAKRLDVIGERFNGVLARDRQRLTHANPETQQLPQLPN